MPKKSECSDELDYYLQCAEYWAKCLSHIVELIVVEVKKL